MGRFIERTQLLAALLTAQLSLDTSTAEDHGADWTSLLRVCHAVDAYNRRYSIEVQPAQVLDLLVTDPLLPVSLHRSLNSATTELASIGPGPDRGLPATRSGRRPAV